MMTRSTLMFSTLLLCTTVGAGRVHATSPSISCVSPPGLCDQMCAEQATTLSEPTASPLTVYSGRCTEVTTLGASGQSAVGCQCAIDPGGNSSLSLIPDLADGACLLEGRAGCLYSKSEFPGCTVGASPDTCDTICAEVQTRLSDDQKRTLAVDVSDAACVEGHGCFCVFKVEGACYFGQPKGANAVDCSDKAADVYEQRFGSAAPDSTQPGGCAAAGASPSAGLILLLLLLGLALTRRTRARQDRQQ